MLQADSVYVCVCSCAWLCEHSGHWWQGCDPPLEPPPSASFPVGPAFPFPPLCCFRPPLISRVFFFFFFFFHFHFRLQAISALLLRFLHTCKTVVFVLEVCSRWKIQMSGREKDSFDVEEHSRGATLVCIQSRFSWHLMNTSPVFTLLSPLFWSLPTNVGLAAKCSHMFTS